MYVFLSANVILLCLHTPTALDAFVLLEVYKVLLSQGKQLGLAKYEMEPPVVLKLKSRMDKKRDMVAGASKTKLSKAVSNVLTMNFIKTYNTRLWDIKYLRPYGKLPPKTSEDGERIKLN